MSTGIVIGKLSHLFKLTKKITSKMEEAFFVRGFLKGGERIFFFLDFLGIFSEFFLLFSYLFSLSSSPKASYFYLFSSYFLQNKWGVFIEMVKKNGRLGVVYQDTLHLAAHHHFIRLFYLFSDF